jgi:hypothetical protein
MTQPAPNTPPTTVPAPSTAIVPATPAKRGGGWATDFVNRLMPSESTAAPSTVQKTTIMQAAGRAASDGVTVAIASGLFGAAHARGWLETATGVAIDGLIGVAALGASVIAAVHAPGLARLAGSVGLAGVASASFRKGFEISSGKPMAPTMAGEVMQPRPGQDRIAAVAAQLDLG